MDRVRSFFDSSSVSLETLKSIFEQQPQPPPSFMDEVGSRMQLSFTKVPPRPPVHTAARRPPSPLPRLPCPHHLNFLRTSFKMMCTSLSFIYSPAPPSTHPLCGSIDCSFSSFSLSRLVHLPVAPRHLSHPSDCALVAANHGTPRESSRLLGSCFLASHSFSSYASPSLSSPSDARF